MQGLDKIEDTSRVESVIVVGFYSVLFNYHKE